MGGKVSWFTISREAMTGKFSNSCREWTMQVSFHSSEMTNATRDRTSSRSWLG